jgi:hypothetical protein
MGMAIYYQTQLITGPVTYSFMPGYAAPGATARSPVTRSIPGWTAGSRSSLVSSGRTRSYQEMQATQFTGSGIIFTRTSSFRSFGTGATIPTMYQSSITVLATTPFTAHLQAIGSSAVLSSNEHRSGPLPTGPSSTIPAAQPTLPYGSTNVQGQLKFTHSFVSGMLLTVIQNLKICRMQFTPYFKHILIF